MPTIDTALSPREILNRLYQRLRYAYSRILSAQPGDAMADKGIVQDIEAMETLMQKLNVSIIKKLRDDANVDINSFEKLKEIEKILSELSTGKIVTIRQDHYIHKLSNHLRNVVRGKVRKSKKSGMKELFKIKKEKKELGKKEVYAKEKIGR